MILTFVYKKTWESNHSLMLGAIHKICDAPNGRGVFAKASHIVTGG